MTRYWFRAKRQGWGWGLPLSWQGWVVLLVYFALVLGGIPLVQAARGSALYLLYVGVVTITLVAICWLTGEPLRWQGDERNRRRR